MLYFRVIICTHKIFIRLSNSIWKLTLFFSTKTKETKMAKDKSFFYAIHFFNHLFWDLHAVVRNNTKRSCLCIISPVSPNESIFQKLNIINTKILTLIQSIALVQLFQFFLYLFMCKNSVLFLFIVQSPFKSDWKRINHYLNLWPFYCKSFLDTEWLLIILKNKFKMFAVELVCLRNRWN